MWNDWIFHIHEKQPVYLHSILAPSLPSHSLRSSKGITLLVPRVKTNTGARAVHYLFGTTCCCLSVQPFQLVPSRDIWRHISLTWPPPHPRQWYIRQPVDAMELFHRFCCWTLIHLSHHWAWLRWGYWSNRNLIDWLIDIIRFCVYSLHLQIQSVTPSVSTFIITIRTGSVFPWVRISPHWCLIIGSCYA